MYVILMSLIQVIYYFEILFPCAMLCVLPFSGVLQYTTREIAATAVLITVPFSVASVVLTGFGISGASFAVSMVYMAAVLIFLRSQLKGEAQKYLFIFFIVAHTAVLGSELELVICTLLNFPVDAAHNDESFITIFILQRVALYTILWFIMSRFYIPSLLKLSSLSVEGLWILPLFFAGISLFRSVVYHDSENLGAIFLVMFVVLAVISFLVYVLLLRVINSVTENAIMEAQAKIKEQSLAAKIEALERINDLKSDFMTTVSHEARTPLAVLSSYAGLVSMKMKMNGADAESAADLDRIVAEAKRVAELFDRMKRLTMKIYEPDGLIKLDFRNLIVQTADLYKPLLERNGVTMEVDIKNELTVNGNPEELTQVMFNILQNAKEHTLSGSVNITAESRDGAVAVIIADTGNGVPGDILPNVLERGVTNRTGGMGVGLAVCKEILNSHGGSITLENRRPNGTAVTIKLPAYKEGDGENG